MDFKKITALAVMAVLCLNFKAGAQKNKAVDLTTQGIQLGQVVPDVIINKLHHYKDKNGKVATSAKLSDFRGKLLILDFWATWCAPCVAMIPKMDSLQKVFGDKVQFLSVTYQQEKEVLPFMEKLEKRDGRKYGIPFMVEDKILSKFFPHVYLPHYVWIDKDGKFRGATGHEALTKGAVDEFIHTGYLKNTWLRNKEGLASAVLQAPAKRIASLKLTGYDPKVSGGFSLRKGTGEKPSKFVLRNNTLHQLYNTAYGNGATWYGRNRVVLKVADTGRIWSRETGNAYGEWLANGNGFCYEQEILEKYPLHRFKFMQDNLSVLFPQYDCVVEKLPTQCLVLERISKDDRLKAKGGPASYKSGSLGISMKGYHLGRFVADLNVMFLSGSSMPVINATGYEDMVDMELAVNPSKLSALNSSLSSYGLALVEREVVIDMLVISDAKLGR